MKSPIFVTLLAVPWKTTLAAAGPEKSIDCETLIYKDGKFDFIPATQ